MKKILHAVLGVFLLSGCSANEPNTVKTELTISAAASLQNVLIEIESEFEDIHPNINLQFNFGSSGALQQQIIQEAPVDLFFSAAEDKFDELVSEGFITESLSTDLVGNELVLIVPKDTKLPIHGFSELPSLEHVSIGTPEAVPAGQYAKETLKTLNLWEALEGKIVYAKDVRQVLTYVETGNVGAGMVYQTDALASDKVNIVATASEMHHRPIVYPVGVVEKGKHPNEAKLFYEFVKSDQVLSIFKKYGFKSLE